MPLEIQSHKIQVNQAYTFTFSDTVAQHMVGFSEFGLSFGQDDHHVQALSISLSTSRSGRAVTVTPQATLKDADGNNISNTASSVTVVTIAWVGVNDDAFKLANASGIGNNSSSQGYPAGSTTPVVLKSALAGFNLAFPSGDHHMQSMSCSVGTSISGSNASITGLVQMYDASGNTASTATVDGGLITNSDRSLDIEVQSSGSLQNKTVKLTFAKAYGYYAVLMSSYTVQFNAGDDNHLKTLSCFMRTTPSGASVEVSGGAYMVDDGSGSQDDANSAVAGFVIGY